MNQCVPRWEMEDPPNSNHPPHHLLQSSNSVNPQLSMLDYEVAELTWENGHLSAQGLVKPTPRYPPPSVVAGTLECIVDQAKLLHTQLPVDIDAHVPTQQDIASGIGSCNNAVDGNKKTKKAKLGDRKSVITVGSGEETTCNTDDYGFTTTNSVTPFFDNNRGRRSPDTEHTSFGGSAGSKPLTIVDDHDSVSPSRQSLYQREACGEEDEKVTKRGSLRSTIPTKRSRAAAIHNQSERKRRDKINQKMRTLQKLVPNSSKNDKASMLDEVIDYLKQLQAQVHMMSRMGGMSSMMMPMGMPQLQMTMMAQMTQMAQMAQMGMGMMDMASLGRGGPPTGIPPVLPTFAFIPMVGGGSWDPSADRMQHPTTVVAPDPFSAFVACPPQQQMTMDGYQKMAALYQQMFQQNQPTNPK